MVASTLRVCGPYMIFRVRMAVRNFGETSLAQLLVQAEAGGDRGIAGAMFLHDLRDDVRHALLLEDAAGKMRQVRR